MSAREYYHHVMWYTVWDAKTGELVAAGASAMCAAKLGYKNSLLPIILMISHRKGFYNERYLD